MSIAISKEEYKGSPNIATTLKREDNLTKVTSTVASEALKKSEETPSVSLAIIKKILESSGFKFTDEEKAMTLRQWINSQILKVLESVKEDDLDSRIQLLELVTLLWDNSTDSVYLEHYKNKFTILRNTAPSENEKKRERGSLYLLCGHRLAFDISLRELLGESQATHSSASSKEQLQGFIGSIGKSTSYFFQILEDLIQKRKDFSDKYYESVQNIKKEEIAKTYGPNNIENRLKKKSNQMVSTETELLDRSANSEKSLKAGLGRILNYCKKTKESLVGSLGNLPETFKKDDFCRELIDAANDMLLYCAVMEKAVQKQDKVEKEFDALELKEEDSKSLVDGLKKNLKQDLEKPKKKLTEDQYKELLKTCEDVLDFAYAQAKGTNINNEEATTRLLNSVYSSIIRKSLKQIGKMKFDEIIAKIESDKNEGLPVGKKEVLEKIEKAKISQELQKHPTDINLTKNDHLLKYSSLMRSFFTFYAQQLNDIYQSDRKERGLQFSSLHPEDNFEWLGQDHQVEVISHDTDEKEDEVDESDTAAKPLTIQKEGPVQQISTWQAPSSLEESVSMVAEVNRAFLSVLATAKSPWVTGMKSQMHHEALQNFDNLSHHHFLSICHVEIMVQLLSSGNYQLFGAIYPRLVGHWSLALKSFFKIEHLKQEGEFYKDDSLVKLTKAIKFWDNFDEKIKDLVKSLDYGSIWARYPYRSLNLWRRDFQEEPPLGLARIIESQKLSKTKEVTEDTLHQVKTFVQSILSTQTTISSYLLKQFPSSKLTQSAAKGLSLLMPEGSLEKLLLSSLDESLKEKISIEEACPFEADVKSKVALLETTIGKVHLVDRMLLAILKDGMAHLSALPHAWKLQKLTKGSHLRLCQAGHMMDIQWIFEILYNFSCFIREPTAPVFKHQHKFKIFTDRLSLLSEDEEFQKERDDAVILRYQFRHITSYPYAFNEPLAKTYRESITMSTEQCGLGEGFQDPNGAKSSKKDLLEQIRVIFIEGVRQVLLQANDVIHDLNHHVVI